MQVTQRELMVAERYAQGATHKTIAASLEIAPATVRNHLASVYRKLEVRNKPELIRALAAHMGTERVGAKAAGTPLTLPLLRNLDADGPPPIVGASIAIMPFENIGPPESAYFGHGVAADLQHNLTRFHDLFVSGRSSCLALSVEHADVTEVARRLGVQYVLQGTVRSHQEMVRLTAELVDGTTGIVLWSERYDRSLRDILEIEAEVASTIATNLSLQIADAEFERRLYLSDNQLSAYDWRLRGNQFLELSGVENLNKARDCFFHSLELEPNSSEALAGLSLSYGYACDRLLTDEYEESLARHLDYAEQAVAADETHSRAHYTLACANLFSGRPARADVHAARSVELNPSEYHNLCLRGYTLMALGDTDNSLTSFDQSLRRNPLAPSSCMRALGVIEYLGSNYSQSAEDLSRITVSSIQKASTLAAAYGQLEMEDDARSAVREFWAMSKEIPSCPANSVSEDWHQFWQRAYPYLQWDALEHVLEGIAKVELPT